jgi:hypothetical protein
MKSVTLDMDFMDATPQNNTWSSSITQINSFCVEKSRYQ